MRLTLTRGFTCTFATGWVGVSFPLFPGIMIPADAVIGYVDDATGQGFVSTYRASVGLTRGSASVGEWHVAGAWHATGCHAT